MTPAPLIALRAHRDARNTCATKELSYTPSPTDVTPCDAFSFFRHEGRLE